MNFKSIRAAQLFASLVFLAIALCSPALLLAQEARGTINGKVRDANQAIVPGASVKIINVAMGTTVTVQTTDAGFYQAPYLLPGTYRITVEQAGFKKYVREKVTLRINETL